MSSALNCNCSPPPTDDYDDYTMVTNDEGTEISISSSSDDESVLNTPYQRVTPLFRNIEKENWEGVLLFLNTGKWSSSIFTNMHEHMRSPAPEIQVKTWVTSYDRRGDPEWSQLPLHAAISYSAPLVVIKKIVDLYPRSIRCTDNEGMLPIHLAFGFGAPDNVLALLAEPFPTSINEKGLGGRYPYECCELGPMKARGKLYKIVSEQIENRVTTEIDKDWKEFVMVAQESVGITAPQDVSNVTLHEFLLELLKERKELGELKQRRQHSQRGRMSARSMTPRSTPSRMGAVVTPRDAAATPRDAAATPRDAAVAIPRAPSATPSVSSRRWPYRPRSKSPGRRLANWGKKYTL